MWKLLPLFAFLALAEAQTDSTVDPTICCEPSNACVEQWDFDLGKRCGAIPAEKPEIEEGDDVCGAAEIVYGSEPSGPMLDPESEECKPFLNSSQQFGHCLSEAITGCLQEAGLLGTNVFTMPPRPDPDMPDGEPTDSPIDRTICCGPSNACVGQWDFDLAKRCGAIPAERPEIADEDDVCGAADIVYGSEPSGDMLDPGSEECKALINSSQQFGQCLSTAINTCLQEAGLIGTNMFTMPPMPQGTDMFTMAPMPMGSSSEGSSSHGSSESGRRRGGRKGGKRRRKGGKGGKRDRKGGKRQRKGGKPGRKGARRRQRMRQ